MKRFTLLCAALTAGFAVFAQDSTQTNTGTATDTTMQTDTTVQTTTTGSTTMPSTMATTTPVLRTPMAVKTRFGLKAGVNMAKLSAKEFTGTAEPSMNNKTGFHVGAFANIPLGGILKLQPELVFSTQGSKMEQRGTGGTGSTTYNFEEDLHYLNLPVMFQLQTLGGFVVETGPQFGYLIDAKQKGRSNISTAEETDLDPFRDNFDIAWGVGVGYLSRVGLGIGARYNYGMRNIVQEDATTGNVGELRNRVLQFSLTYQFGAYK